MAWFSAPGRSRSPYRVLDRHSGRVRDDGIRYREKDLRVAEGVTTGRQPVTESVGSVSLRHHQSVHAAILSRRERIKRRTLLRRKQENLNQPNHAAIRPEVSLKNGVQLSNFV